MKPILSFLLCCFLLLPALFGCSASRWSQFHADEPNSGFNPVRSGYALEPKWATDVAPAGFSSPVLGINGMMVIGSENGFLTSLDSSGNEVFKVRPLGEANAVISSPAVGQDGNIYVTATERMGEGFFQSALYSYRPSGDLRWSYSLPGDRITLSAPKALGAGSNLKLFLSTRANWATELFVIDGNGNLIERKITNSCTPPPITNSGIFDLLEDIWDLITDFPVEFDTSGIPWIEYYGWPNPTVAIVEPSRDSDQPLIAVANTCSITVHRSTSTGLEKLWEDTYDSTAVSSPAVFPSGLMALGRADGILAFYDVATGVRLGEPWYDAEEPIASTPASAGRQIFALSYNYLHIVEPNGSLVRKIALDGQALSSPAVTASHVYVSTSNGLLSFPITVVEDGGFASSFDGVVDGGVSSPAVGNDGTVYVVERIGSQARAYPRR